MTDVSCFDREAMSESSDDSFDIVDEKEYGALSESGSSSESSSSGDDETRMNLDKFEETVAQARAKVELAKTTSPAEASAAEAPATETSAADDSAAESNSSDSSASSDDDEKYGITIPDEIARAIVRSYNRQQGEPETSEFESPRKCSCAMKNCGRKLFQVDRMWSDIVYSDDEEEVERKTPSSESETSVSETSDTSSDSDDDDYENDDSKSEAKVRKLATILARGSYKDVYSSDDDEEVEKRAPSSESETSDTSSDSDDDEEDSTCSTDSKDDEIQYLRERLNGAVVKLQDTKDELYRERDQHMLTQGKLNEAKREADASKRELQSATEKLHAFDTEIRPRIEILEAKSALQNVAPREKRTLESIDIVHLKSQNSDLQKMVKNFQGALRVKDVTEKEQNKKIDRLIEEVRLLRNALASETNLKKLYKEKILKLIDQGNRVMAAQDDRDQAVKSIITKVSVGETYTPSCVFCV